MWFGEKKLLAGGFAFEISSGWQISAPCLVQKKKHSIKQPIKHTPSKIN